ncbi:MAG: amidohydrolase [Candidatus Bipolaricaulis sp.]|nr:amidohydrolase [Candidatus Bipolaricaulis sp.]
MGILLRDVRLPERGATSFWVRIRADRIDGVSSEPLAPDAGDEIVDAGGKLAISGFVNAHTHLPMVLLRGLADDVPLEEWLERHVWPVERKLSPEDVYWCTLLALAEAVRGGTVAVADMYFHTDRVAQAVEESGVRALLSYGMIARSMSEGGEKELRTTERIAATWQGAAGGRIGVAVSPHSTYTCGEDVWGAAKELAQERGLRIHTHVSESRREVATVRAQTGGSPPEYLERLGVFEVPVLAAHCVHVSPSDLDLLGRGGVAVAHCPKSNSKLGSGLAPVAAMRARGIRVALGTDGAASNNRLDMIEELRAAWLLARGPSEDPRALSAKDAVLMATEEGRVALGLPPARLQPGDAADIVLLSLDGVHTTPAREGTSTIAFASQSSDVTDVLVAGQWLMRDGRLLTIDEERVQSEVGRLLRRHTN